MDLQQPDRAVDPRVDAGAAAPTGRQYEWTLLHDALTLAVAGRGALIFIGGEAGIGKTTLARSLGRSAARDGARFLIGRCYDFASNFPYGLWFDLAEHFAIYEGVPILPHASPPPGPGDVTPNRAAFFGRWYSALAALAPAPVVLLLEDLHWADAASLDLLQYLARHIAGLPILLLATYRTDELERTPLATLLPALCAAGEARRLDLERLDHGAIRQLLHQDYHLPSVDEARLADYLYARTHGNSFFLREMRRALESSALLYPTTTGWYLGDLDQFPLPPHLEQIIVARVQRLGAPLLQGLQQAAIIGQELPLALWASLSRLDEGEFLELVERALAAGFVEETADGSRVRFAHALVREALYSGLSAPRRRLWHRLVGEALLAGTSPDPDVVAYHFRRAGDPRAFAWLIAAGERAQRSAAWLDAAAHFTEALALLAGTDGDAVERGWLLLRLALLRRYDDSRQALGLLERAVADTLEARDRALSAYTRFNLGLLRCFAGEYRRGVVDLERGAAEL